MGLDLAGLVTLVLLSMLPLSFSTAIEDVFFGPWRAGLCVCLGFLALWTAWRSRRGPLVLDAARLPWALFFVWTLAATFWSANPADSFRRTLELLGSITGFWLGLHVANKWRKYSDFVVLAAAICSIYAALQVAGLDWLPWSTRFGRRAFGTLANPDYYAGHLLLVLPLAGASLLAARGMPPIRILAFLLLSAGLLFSQVRGAWLAAAAVAAFAAWRLFNAKVGREAKKKLGMGLAACCLLLAAGLLFSSAIRQRVAGSLAFGGYDATGRRYLWTVAGHMLRASPLVGFGTDGYKFAFPRFQIIGVNFGLPHFRPYNYSEHAHNEIAQFAAELGLIGAGLFLWGLINWACRWGSYLANTANSRASPDWWSQIGMGLGILAGTAYSAVNFPFQIVPTAFLWWTMLGASQGSLGRDPALELPKSAGRIVLAGLAVLALTGSFLSFRDLVGNGYFQRLRALGEQGTWQAAIRYGQKARILLPHDYRVARWLSVVAIGAGEQELAEENIAARLNLHPHLADALADRAKLANKLGRYEQAEELFRKLVTTAPNFAAGWGELGTLYFERGEFAAAAEAFGQAAFYQTNDPVWPHNQASALGQMKKYREALDADTEAIRRDPTFQEAYVGLALSARAIGKTDQARAAARKALSLNPQDRRAYRLLMELEKQ